MIYVVTGKLGCGKTLLAVSKIREALLAGRRVATNLDLRLEYLLPAGHRVASCIRVPDKPSADDLQALGLGSEVLDESRYGLLVLDELGSWLNARAWGDKGRALLLDWLIHSRKCRWDVIFICQHLSQIDKQVRESLAEYVVVCKRLDRIRIPFLGTIGRWLTLGAWGGTIGKVHMGIVTYAAGGSAQSPLVVDRWFYRGTDLYQGYDTEQVFVLDLTSASFSYLSPWLFKGRYLPPEISLWLLWLGSFWPGLLPDVRRPVRPCLAFGAVSPFQSSLLSLPPDRLWSIAKLLAESPGCRAAAAGEPVPRS